MAGCRCNISLVFVLTLLISIQAYSQQVKSRDSLNENNIQKVDLKPRVHYSVGSNFMIIPHLGTITGFTGSAYLSVPLSPKLSVDGGIIAGRFYSSFPAFSPEGARYGAFNEFSVFGSASYHLNSQLTLYGAGIRQLTATSPLYALPKSSYTIGSTYNFGNFSIGVALHMSKWNNGYNPLPINGSPGFYSPFEK